MLDVAKAMGYDEEATLFDVLFANEEAKSYPAKDAIMEDFDNSEVFGDSRKVVGSDGKVFETGISLPLICEVVVGGAMFGDNLSFISDTTIAATRTQEVEMKDKFKVNILIVLPAVILNIIIVKFYWW